MTRADNNTAAPTNEDQWLLDMLDGAAEEVAADEAAAQADAVAQAAAALDALRSAKALLAAAAAAVHAADTGRAWEHMAQLAGELESASDDQDTAIERLAGLL